MARMPLIARFGVAALVLLALVPAAAAGRTPSAIFAVGFGFLMLEFAFALVTAAFSSGRLGELAWARVAAEARSTGAF